MRLERLEDGRAIGRMASAGALKRWSLPAGKPLRGAGIQIGIAGQVRVDSVALV